MRFEVTENHLKLIKELIFEHDDSSYDGAPGADLKRPYGNSGPCSYDVPRILGMEAEDNEFSEGQIAECRKIHNEVYIALQICCCLLKFETGLFEQTSEFDCKSWKKVKESI